jgi:hypothetical protein
LLLLSLSLLSDHEQYVFLYRLPEHGALHAPQAILQLVSSKDEIHGLEFFSGHGLRVLSSSGVWQQWLK